MPLYNTNPNTGECVDSRQVDHSGSIDDFIENLKSAAEGLTEAHIEIEHEDDYDTRWYTVSVVGKRKMTDREIEEDKRKRDLTRRQNEHMRNLPKF